MLWLRLKLSSIWSIGALSRMNLGVLRCHRRTSRLLNLRARCRRVRLVKLVRFTRLLVEAATLEEGTQLIADAAKTLSKDLALVVWHATAGERMIVAL